MLIQGGEAAPFEDLMQDLTDAGRGEYEFQVPAHWSAEIEAVLDRINTSKSYTDDDAVELRRLYDLYADEMEARANHLDSETELTEPE